MLGWFKHVQEVTTDLPKVASIVLQQNSNSLKWASDRLWEFAGLLAHTYTLLPDRVHNGLDWVDSYNETPDNLVFFDHLYGVGQDVYGSDGVSFRLGLQCLEGSHPISFVECKLIFDILDEEEEATICSGDITLIGQRGVWWSVKVQFSCLQEQDTKELEEHFGALIPSEQIHRNDGSVRYEAPLTAFRAREFFHKMVQYFISKQG